MNDKLPMIMRAMPGMKIERNHWTYSGLRPDGTRVGLWGGDALYPAAKTDTLQAPMLIDHRTHYRDRKHTERRDRFGAAVARYVERNGIEP
jgi:hypothetical protein